MLLVPVYLILLFPLIVVSFSPSVFLFRCVLHPLPLSSCLGCIPSLIGLPSLRFYAVASSLFLLSVCFLFMFSILSRRYPLLATSLSVLFCLLSMLISDSRFDLVWFRLSCDHGWIRSGSVNVRKQQQQQQHATPVSKGFLRLLDSRRRNNNNKPYLCEDQLCSLTLFL